MILFATQNFLPSVGGTQIYVTGLADALAAKGHGVEVFCDTASKGAAAKVDQVRNYPIRRFGGPRPLMRRRKARALVKRVAQGGVTAVITDTWKSLEHLPAESLSKLRVLCLGHGNEFLHAPESAKGKLLIACLAKADIVAANSQFTADLARPFTSGKTRIRVIWPGIVPPLGASRTAPRKDQDGPAILTIARLEPRKGIDVVLRALPALLKTHPDLSYDIGGKGDDRERLEGLVRSLELGKHVRFHGFTDEQMKAEMLQRADIFALPNRREHRSVEGFGIVFMEAAAYGVPSIAGMDGGASDAVLDGKTGLIADGESDAAVLAVLSRMLSNAAERRAMGNAARARFWKEFAWDAAIGRFENALFGELPG